MLLVLKNKFYFTTLFFIVLVIDIFFKLSENPLPARFFTKSLIVILLAFYFFKNRDLKLKNDIYFFIALACFLIGDVFLLLYENQILYIIGLICFIFGKLFYIKRFSNNNDFNLAKLIPFLIAIFIYMVIIVLFVYDNLGNFLYPTFVYLFVSMLLALFAFLRQGSVNRQSYYLVLVGVFFGICSDSIAVLQSFYNPDLAYHKTTIMLFYALFQYFTVLGVAQEKLVIEDGLNDNFIKL